MNIFMIMHLITAALVTLKLCVIVTLPWYIIFTPSLIAFFMGFLIIGLGVLMFQKVSRGMLNGCRP